MEIHKIENTKTKNSRDLRLGENYDVGVTGVPKRRREKEYEEIIAKNFPD